MNFIKAAGCALLLCASVNAGVILHYTGPVLDRSSGDPSLFPAGLGDHFDITITLPSLAVGSDYVWGDLNPPPQATFSWSDGAIQFAIGSTALFGADQNEIALPSPGHPVVSLFGVNGEGVFAFSGGVFGADAVIACPGGSVDPTECSPNYIQYSSAGNGTWTMTTTPEPQSMLMAAAGLLALAGLTRRRGRN
jgi:hypothetical protein